MANFISLRRQAIRRNQESAHLYKIGHGRQEQFLGYRIHCCWWSLHCAWRLLHCGSSLQTKVCLFFHLLGARLLTSVGNWVTILIFLGTTTWHLPRQRPVEIQVLGTENVTIPCMNASIGVGSIWTSNRLVIILESFPDHILLKKTLWPLF